jgi:hypothetical protein
LSKGLPRPTADPFVMFLRRNPRFRPASGEDFKYIKRREQIQKLINVAIKGDNHE